jgi:hypothetical protein
MEKQEFLAASLPYRPKCKTMLSEGVKDIVAVSFGDHVLFRVAPIGGYRDFPILTSNIIPIVRHLDDLKKECVQAGYNNGEPFIPIVELVKMLEGEDILVLECNQMAHLISVAYLDPYKTISKFTYNMYDPTFYSNWENTSVPISQLQLFQQLLKWHFDLITEECERVYVTEDFNPYK